MAIVKVLGVDASLRFTGLAVVSYDTKKSTADPEAYSVNHCKTLVNPPKYKSTDAILNMIDMIQEESQKSCYMEPETVIVESPPLMFNKDWGAGTISLIAHISGASIALFGVERGYLFQPSQWNGKKKKIVTHTNAEVFLGSHENWHYEKKLRSEKQAEHILDAASMALWWIRKTN